MLEQSFFKLAIHNIQKCSKKFVARYISSILKFKIKNSEMNAWGKLKSNRLRYKALINFAKLLSFVEINKKRPIMTLLKLNK